MRSSARLSGLAIVAAVSLTLTARHAGAAVIAEYSFAGGSAASTDTEPNSTAADFTKNPASSDWGFSSSSSTVFARSNATTASEAAAVTAGDYFSFTVAPDAGFELDLTQLQFDTTHNLTHPTPPSPDTGATMSFFVRSSVDGFAANIGPVYSQAWDTTTPRTVDLSAAAFRDIQVPTEFRIYIHDSGVNLEENGARLDNVILGGTVVPPGTTVFQEGVSPTAAYTHDAVHIRSNQPTTNQNGAGQIIIGLAATGNERLRGLFEFDVSAIAASDQIDSVSLDLTTLSSSAGINNVGGAGALTTFNVYEYGFDFDETTATWNAPAAGDVAGGTLGTLLTSASFDVEITDQKITFDDTAAFRTAVSDALAGDGFLRLILANNDETNLGSHDFARFADETAAAASRPRLLVTHSSVVNVIPEPSSLVLWALAVLGLACFGRRRAKPPGDSR